MKKVSVFNCRIRRKRRHTQLGEVYELVREYVVGEDDVLLQGSYQTCHDALQRYHAQLISDPEQYVVQWCDEFSIIVHQLVEPEWYNAKLAQRCGG